jgi:TfoX/Sxy family transcriptional regulator of competence genes
VNPVLDALRRDLEDAATHLGRPHDLRFHAMFGGLMAYFGEKPCAWLSTQGLALKLAAEDQLDLLAREGARRFEPRPGLPLSRQYIVLPSSLCSDTAQLAMWLERSAEARSMPKKKGPRPKTRP